MQEEIGMSEILETIWNSKWLIVIITTVTVLLTGLTSKFILEPTYESTSIVRVGDGSGEEVLKKLNSFAESLKTDVSFKRIIDKLGLDETQYSINSLRSKTKIEVIKDTSLIKLTVQGEDPETITNISNLLAFELAARIEISDRAQEIVALQKRLEQIDDNIAIMSNDLEEAERLLSETPEYLVTRQTLADEPYLHSVITESTNGSSRELGAVQLESQSINPVYTLLKNRITENTLAITRLSKEKDNIIAELAFNNARILELEQQIDREKLTASNSQRLLNGLNAVFISPAITPEAPVKPNIVMNVAISFLAALILCSLIVYLRYIMKAANIVKNIDNTITE